MRHNCRPGSNFALKVRDLTTVESGKKIQLKRRPLLEGRLENPPQLRVFRANTYPTQETSPVDCNGAGPF